MRWAFIDYENIGCLSKIDLSTYSRIIFFLGAKQPKIDFGDKKYDFPLDMVLIQLKAIQANNLDFHLSYYLGKYDNEAAENVLFEVISNDNGFTPLIAHIKANGRACKQIKSTTATTQKSKLINSLTSQPQKKRPKKITSLKNHIATHMRIQGNEVAIQNLLNQLVNEKVIAVAGESIEYKY